MENQLVKFNPETALTPETAELQILELCPNYWTPTEIGEYKDLYFMGFGEEPLPSFSDSKILEERSVVKFMERKDGDFVAITSAATILLNEFERLHAKGNASIGDLFRVQFLGREDNKNNKNSSFKWSIRKYIKKS